MVSYLLIKGVHQAAVIFSVSLFSVRAIGSLCGARWPKWPPLRISQHVNDSILLLAAVTLAFLSGLAPWNAPWLAAKIIGLLVYIILGALAMRDSLPLPGRITAFLCALLMFGFIISVAVSRSPWGFFG